MKILRSIIVLLTLVIGYLGWDLRCAYSDLSAEKLNHAKTRIERDDYKLKYESEQIHADGLSDNVRACLDREARAQKEARTRSRIMEKAIPRQRTENEKEKIVDDDTRRAVVERLNRELRYR